MYCQKCGNMMIEGPTEGEFYCQVCPVKHDVSLLQRHRMRLVGMIDTIDADLKELGAMPVPLKIDDASYTTPPISKEVANVMLPKD